MRRQSFQTQMTAAVDGFGEHTLDAFLWGQWYGDQATGDRSLGRPPGLGVVSKLRRRRHLCAHLPPRPHTAHRESNATQSESVGEFLVAPTLESCLPHSRIVPRGRGEILCEEVAELARLGATYIQIDAPHYALLIDPTTRRFYEQQAAQAGRAASMQQWLERALELDNALISAAPAVTYGFHLCRGNQDSRWLAEGSYEPIAPIVFQKIKAHRLLLEYDDVRSGSFEPLRHVPDDKFVVLGLITTKTRRMETRQEVTERVRQASCYVPLERRALSPQCGFASSVIGNRMVLEDEDRKLRLLVETPRAVWG